MDYIPPPPDIAKPPKSAVVLTNIEGNVGSRSNATLNIQHCHTACLIASRNQDILFRVYFKFFYVFNITLGHQKRHFILDIQHCKSFTHLHLKRLQIPTTTTGVGQSFQCAKIHRGRPKSEGVKHCVYGVS